MTKLIKTPVSRLICLGRARAITMAVANQPIPEEAPGLGYGG